MPAATSWKLISMVSAVQVLSEGAFFAQGILASDDTNAKTSRQREFEWIRICVPLFYAAIRQISEPCWRWILRGYGDRMTTALGISTVTVSVVVASCQGIIAGSAAYIFLGGIGMGLVRLQIKLMKSNSGEAECPLWGAGISGIGLSLWPLIACLCVRSLGPRYAMLIFAGITLHAVPLAMFAVRPKEEEERDAEIREEDIIVSASISPEVAYNSPNEYRVAYPLIDYNSYRIRPSYYVEVLPGIPEEVEHDSDHERDHEMQRAFGEDAETGKIQKQDIAEVKSSSKKNKRGKKSKSVMPESVALKRRGIQPKPFAYTVFVTKILLRLADQLNVTIVISLVPILASHLMPNLRLQEKAFLISLCGFSKILSEFPLLALYMRSKKTKVVFLCGPLLAAVGLYLTWNSGNLDSMTLASFGLGIGSGAASATLQIISPRESSRVCDAADITVGVSLLAIIPLTRIFILGNAVQGCLLIAAGIYAAAAITSVFSLRRTA